jgi:hypothetical protein
LRYLLRAVGDKRAKPSYRGVYVDEDGTGYATDGKRLHIVKDAGVAQGSYFVVKNTQTVVALDGAEIPQLPYQKVIPTDEELSAVEKVVLGGGPVEHDTWCFVARIARECPHEFVLDYLTDAIPERPCVTDVRWMQSRPMLTVESGDFKAVIVGYVDC